MDDGPKVVGSAQCTNPFVAELEVSAVVRPAGSEIPDRHGRLPTDLEWEPTYDPERVINYGVIARSKFSLFNRLGKFVKRTWQESEAVVKRTFNLE